MISYIYKRVRDGGHFAYTVLGISIYTKCIYFSDWMRECTEDRNRGSGTIDRDYQGRIQGGGGGRRARAPPFQKV